MFEVLNVVASVGTFVVLAATGFAALIQLRHLRASNQLGALLSLERDFSSPDLQQSFRFVQRELDYRLGDPNYRAELARIGFVDSTAHPEINVCNWFNEMGALLKNNLVDESAFMDLFSRLAVQYWEILSPVVAIMRRRRGDGQYHNFEYLAIRARRWLSTHPAGHFPKGMARIPLLDSYLETDEPQESGGLISG
jgi:hypothetical protein